MSVRLYKIPFVRHVADLWGQITEKLKPKKVDRKTRQVDFQELYWAESPVANQECNTALSLDGWMGDEVNSADYWYMKGEALVRDERMAEAEDCFDRAMRLDPHDPCILIYRAYCLYRLGSYEAALTYLKQMPKLKPMQPEISIVEALCLCHLQQFEEALRHFTNALRCGLETPVIWNNKGFCLARLGRCREASAAFKIALSKCSTESLEILCNAASVLLELGAGKQALNYFDRALDINAEDHILLNNMAFCLERLGRHGQALKCYEKALALEPDSLTYLNNQGLCLLRLQQWDRACECLEEVTRRDPGNGIAWCGLAAISLARGSFDEALNFYNKAFATS